MIQIRNLGDVPQLRLTIADWIHGEFLHELAGISREMFRQDFGSGDRTVFVALVDDVPAATASLDPDDLPIRPSLTPWLASVFTLPAYRGNGIGGRLIERVEEEARLRGYRRVYLHTADHRSFYEKRGWHVIERVECWGKLLDVMNKEII